MSSNILDSKAFHKLTTDITKDDEDFLKEFSIDFYQKITDMEDFNTIENTLIEWIKNAHKNIELILGLMQNHKQTKLWFSSIIGFFYQHGVGCDPDKDKALKLYLLIINNDEKEFLIKEENDILQSINIIIGKYLLSLFYYKDIILGKRKLINDSAVTKHSTKTILQKLQNQLLKYKMVNDNKNTIKNDLKQQENLNYLEDYNKKVKKILETTDQKIFNAYMKSAENGDPMAQWNLGKCYFYGRGITQDFSKAFEWFSNSANNGYAKGQCDLGSCYYYGRGIAQDYN